jgi:hypothetical protein
MGLVVSAGSPVPREPFPAAADLSPRAQKVAIGAESAQLPERAYVAWPEAIRQGFEPARTVKTGTLKVELLPQEDRA